MRTANEDGGDKEVRGERVDREGKKTLEDKKGQMVDKKTEERERKQKERRINCSDPVKPPIDTSRFD